MPRFYPNRKSLLQDYQDKIEKFKGISWLEIRQRRLQEAIQVLPKLSQFETYPNYYGLLLMRLPLNNLVKLLYIKLSVQKQFCLLFVWIFKMICAMFLDSDGQLLLEKFYTH